MIVYGVVKPGVVFRFKLNGFSVIGLILVLYSMVIYPIIGYKLGHVFPQSPVFGAAPCPSTVFTFGLLLLAEKLPKKNLIIPLMWSIVGLSAAIHLGIREDIGMLIAGLVGTSMILIRDWKNKQKTLDRNAGSNALEAAILCQIKDPKSFDI